MGRATAKFIKEIQGDHHVIAYVDVVAPSGHKIRLNTVDGGVNVDRSAATRRAGTVVAVDETGALMPKDGGGPLTPLGTEVYPYRGVVYADGTTEVYPLGVFHLSACTVAESVGTAGGNFGLGTGTSTTSVGSPNTGAVSYSLTLYDRSWRVSRDKFTTIYTVPKGTNLITAIKQIIGRTYPDMHYDAISTTRTNPSPLVYDVGADPWQSATSIATSLGCDLYFDVDGDVVIAPPPDVNHLSKPDFTYIEGQQCAMTALNAVYDDAPTFNGVVVTGASIGATNTPVRAVAWDTDADSPTYKDGSYGRVPMFVNDTTITTTAAAQTAANAQLAALLGFSGQVSVTAWVNPALEAGDVLQVEREALNVTGLFTPEAFNIPLSAAKNSVIIMRQRKAST